MLDRLCQENIALSPCVEAMVTNIDGTGYDFTPVHGEQPDNYEDETTDELNESSTNPGRA